MLVATTAYAAEPVGLPAGLEALRDLRAPFRAAFCARVTAAECATSLRAFNGESVASAPPAVDAGRYRVLFVPGFLASCFPGIHSFGDVIEAARAQGFAAQALAVGGRDGVAANARTLAGQVARIADDGKRLVFVAHSKGALDTLAMLGENPDIAARTDAVVTIAGAVRGSPLADTLRAAYALTLAPWPFSGCERGVGDPLDDLSPAGAARLWHTMAGTMQVPVYSLVALPDLGAMSPAVVPTWLRLKATAGDNDGMVAVRDQVLPGGALLGVANADHIRVAIPYPGSAYVMLISAQPFPRAALLFAALDTIAADTAARVR